MKKLIVFFLTIFMQIQSAWALGQAYSSHSFDAATSHSVSANEHECYHSHNLSSNVQSTYTDETANSADNHCGVCHTACLSILLFNQPTTLADKASQKAKPTQAALHTDDVIDSIERPIWRNAI